MLHLTPKIKSRLKSQRGFVLIATIMAVMIIIAVGFFALTISTKDIRISSRLVGERKAFSAAEGGVNEVCRTLNPFAPPDFTAWTNIDATNDPSSQFSASPPVFNTAFPSVMFPGFSLGQSYAGAVFDTMVTGSDTAYGSSAAISVGIAYAPAPSDTQH